jgi:hypothetical protein
MWGKIIYSELTLAIAMRLLSRSLPFTRIVPAPSSLLTRTLARQFSSSNSKMRKDPFKPAARVAGQKQDVWSIVNEAAASSKVSDVVNMGQVTESSDLHGWLIANVSIDRASSATTLPNSSSTLQKVLWTESNVISTRPPREDLV